jgi:hypothetical protein
MKHFFYAVALLCYGAAESSAQYFNDFDSWPIMEGSSWTQSGPGGTWHGDGTYVNFGNEYSGLRKVGFNDVGDVLELPPVTNPESVSFYARLSSGSLARLALEEYSGGSWKTLFYYNVTQSRYLFFLGDPEIPGENVRLRLRMTTYGNSVYLDDLQVTTFVLPVELAEFSAAAGADGAVHLRWRTLTETGNERFDVQRSPQGVTFETISTVAGAGTTTTPRTYAFKDPAPHPGVSYYRLRQVDFDGTEDFSPVRSVYVPEERGALRITPTLVQHELRITVTPVAQKRQLRIFHRNGSMVLYQTLAPGTEELVTNIGSIPKGLYFVELEGRVVRFVKL